MTRGGGLASRLTRLEAADSAACPVCHGNAIRLKWVGIAAAGSGELSSTNADDYPAETCAGCGRRCKLIFVSWRTDADEETLG